MEGLGEGVKKVLRRTWTLRRRGSSNGERGKGEGQKGMIGKREVDVEGIKARANVEMEV